MRGLVDVPVVEAVLAAPVHLEPMRLDLVAGAAGELGKQRLDVAGGEVVHRPAARADDVVVMAGAGKTVLHRPVIEHNLAQRADVLEQAQGAKNGRAADAGRGHDHAFGREMVAEAAHRLEQRTTRGGHAMAVAHEFSLEQVGGYHAPMVCPAPRPVNEARFRHNGDMRDER
jgi:hypothetical protein